MIWISGKRADAATLKDVPSIDPDWATDGLVREYASIDELTAHVNGTLDYLGHAPAHTAVGGTWLRFEPEGLNIIGEYHSHLRFLDLVVPLKIRRWLDESYISEKLAADSHVLAAYVPTTAPGARGITIATADLHLYGLEAMWPKTAYLLPSVIDYIDGRLKHDLFGAGTLMGMAARYALKLSWAYARDLAAGKTTVVPVRQAPPRQPSAAEQGLAAMVADVLLDKFFTELPDDGYLGVHFDPSAQPELATALRKLTTAAITVMYERLTDEPKLGLVDRKSLEGKPRATAAQQRQTFNDWRNARFAMAVETAARDRVRYIGIGVNHLAYLIENKKVPAGAHLYDFRPPGATANAVLDGCPELKTLTAMIARTQELHQQV